MSVVTWALILSGVGLNAAAQLLLKAAARPLAGLTRFDAAPVSVAYPMLSLGYVVVAAASVLWLGETLSPAKVLGIGLICLGVVLVSRSSV
ncbi:MAG TPA: EamA family transporter [Steroidobacteraceae bacterium]|nr:EamA family transporter [Steroidobacteraceae bacterium]